MRFSAPKLLLHVEGLIALVAASLVYSKLSASWSYFALLFLAPDVSMLGYLAGKPIGAWCYNAAHTYLAPAALAFLIYAADRLDLVYLPVIWVAHIGFDRLLGYGLKYPTDFKDTHLHRL